MKYLLWYIFGAGAVYGGYYYYTKMKDLCINDLPEPMKTQVLEAVKNNDKDKLLSFASQADDKGYKCSAKEMRDLAVNIDKKTETIVPVIPAIKAVTPLGDAINNAIFKQPSIFPSDVYKKKL